uniref:Probable arginine--tRNA ligase, mitochondrial n=1 Tax=Syphacia muris TaxID=451379 RepID=A0A158R448_9BILA
MKDYLRRLLSSKSLFADLLRPKIEVRKKILIDYSSPNIAKQFHIGNLRSTLIGRFIDVINRTAGNEVISYNFLGDWGTQFSLMATLWPDCKPSEEVWNKSNDFEKIKLLTRCYVEANKLHRSSEVFKQKVQTVFQEMESALSAGDLLSPKLEFWNEVRKISLRHLNSFYRDLNISHDVTAAESENVKLANELADEFIARGLTVQTSDGLTVFKTKDIPGYEIIRKSDNTTLDLASLIKRDEVYAADRYLYVVDTSQSSHFVYMKAALKDLGRIDLANKVEHIPFGRVVGLSTRRGRTESVAEILEEGFSLAKKFILASETMKVTNEELDGVARALSTSIVVTNDLKHHRTSEYVFSFDKAYQMKRVNGLLLQMKHSRLVSLEEHNKEIMRDILLDWPYQLEFNDQTMPLINHINSLDMNLFSALALSEPCKVTTYLLKLANLVGTAMVTLRVSGEPPEKAFPRMLIFATVRKILHEGIKILGVDPVYKM